MLEKKIIDEIEKNIMEHKGYEITNDEFLRTIFGEYTDDQHGECLKFCVCPNFIFSEGLFVCGT